MSSIVRISEAASMALHAMVMLATSKDEPLSVSTMAGALHGSEAHMAKVLQRLARAGYVRSARGPFGGYLLAREGDEITLLEVYEAIEGPLRESECLLAQPVCGGECILGGLLSTLNSQVRDYLARMKVADLARSGLTMLESGRQTNAVRA